MNAEVAVALRRLAFATLLHPWLAEWSQSAQFIMRLTEPLRDAMVMVDGGAEGRALVRSQLQLMELKVTVKVDLFS